MDGTAQIIAYFNYCALNKFIETARAVEEIIVRWDGKRINTRLVNQIESLSKRFNIPIEVSYDKYGNKRKYDYFFVQVDWGDYFDLFKKKYKFSSWQDVDVRIIGYSWNRDKYFSDSRILSEAWILAIEENIEKIKTKKAAIRSQMKGYEEARKQYKEKKLELLEIDKKASTIMKERKDIEVKFDIYVGLLTQVDQEVEKEFYNFKD